jgi:hypothetical protein
MDNLPEDQTKTPPFLSRVNNKSVIEILGKESFIKSLLEKGDEIVAY